MAAKAAVDELELLELAHGHGGSGGIDERRGSNGGGPARIPQHIYVTGIVLALLGILTFFLALTSAYLVRKGLSTDWTAYHWPQVLWFNTGLLLVSSFTAEAARRALRLGEQALFRRWWGITTVLGFGFLAGQLVAWRQLADQGIYIATNPNSSFFYTLTGLHGLHLLGGLVALVYVGLRGPRPPEARLSQETAVRVASIYWHFLDGLWILLFLLLLLGQ